MGWPCSPHYRLLHFVDWTFLLVLPVQRISNFWEARWHCLLLALKLFEQHDYLVPYRRLDFLWVLGHSLLREFFSTLNDWVLMDFPDCEFFSLSTSDLKSVLPPNATLFTIVFCTCYTKRHVLCADFRYKPVLWIWMRPFSWASPVVQFSVV